LHVHLVPRPGDDIRAGGPVEAEAFEVALTPALNARELAATAAALRTRLQG
jgi:hypothetical protein